MRTCYRSHSSTSPRIVHAAAGILRIPHTHGWQGTTHSVLLRFRMFRLGHTYTLCSNADQETGSNTLTVRFTVLRFIRCHTNHIVPGVLLCNWVSLRPSHQAKLDTNRPQAEDSNRVGFVAVSLIGLPSFSVPRRILRGPQKP